MLAAEHGAQMAHNLLEKLDVDRRLQQEEMSSVDPQHWVSKLFSQQSAHIVWHQPPVDLAALARTFRRESDPSELHNSEKRLARRESPRLGKQDRCPRQVGAPLRTILTQILPHENEGLRLPALRCHKRLAKSLPVGKVEPELVHAWRNL